MSHPTPPTSRPPIEAARLPSETGTLLVAEYGALRDEILRKQDFSSKLVEITLVATATFLALGARAGISEVALLLFPVLVGLLALAWAQQQAAMGEIGRYIKAEIEPLTGGALAWEGYLDRHRPGPLRSNLAIAVPAAGVFVTSQAVTLLLGIIGAVEGAFTPLDGALTAIGALAILGTVVGMAALTRLNRPNRIGVAHEVSRQAVPGYAGEPVPSGGAVVGGT